MNTHILVYFFLLVILEEKYEMRSDEQKLKDMKSEDDEDEPPVIRAINIYHSQREGIVQECEMLFHTKT